MTAIRTTTLDLRGQSTAPGVGLLTPGRATVLKAQDRGPGGPGQQVFDVQLLVQPIGSAPYPLTSRLLVPDVHRPRTTIGASLPVKLDPADPNRIIVEWNQP